jgi:hypothetical protein
MVMIVGTVLFFTAYSIGPFYGKASEPFIDSLSASKLATVYSSNLKRTSKGFVPFLKESTTDNWKPFLQNEVWFCTFKAAGTGSQDEFTSFMCIGIGCRDGTFLGATVTPVGFDKWKTQTAIKYRQKAAIKNKSK